MKYINQRTAILVILAAMLAIAGIVVLSYVTKKPIKNEDSIVKPIVENNENDSPIANTVDGIVSKPAEAASSLKIEYYGGSLQSSSTLRKAQIVSGDIQTMFVDLRNTFKTSKRITDTFYMNEETNVAVQLDTQRQLIQYTKETDSSNKTAVDLKKAQDSALSFFKQMSPDQKYQPYEQGISYYEQQSNGELLELTDERKATAQVVKIPYHLEIDGQIVNKDMQKDGAATVFIDGTGTVIKAVFLPLKLNIQETEEVELLTPAEATKRILYGQSIIFNQTKDPTAQSTFRLQDLSSMRLNSVSLEYRLSVEKGYIYPYFRYVGVVRVNGGGDSPVVVLVPAMKSL
jgi:hypothetical protein